MRSKTVYLFFMLLVLFPGQLGLWGVTDVQGEQAVSKPVLKWAHGGCYSSWCETGWYSSPAVADLDGDGAMEVIGGLYTIFILDGADGSLIESVDTPGSRVWPGVVVADLEGDGDLEIVTAQGGGYVNVLDHNGEIVWTRQPAGNEFRSLAVADLEGDGDLEIVVGLALLSRTNVWVLEHNGSTRPGWPRLADGEGSAAGLYNDNIGLGDLDNDGTLEVVVPSDTITIGAYEPNGSQMPTHVMYHDHPGHDMDFWSEVPAYVELAYEIQGYGPCYTEFTARANFANGPANVVDVNGDGVNELVVIGDVHNCNTSPYTDLYNGPTILNADRSRFAAGGYDWSTLPVNTGSPLIQDYYKMENAQPNPVTADLDGDGELEILYPSYDGRMHAFWLDKSEHHNWPYAIYTGGPYRFATEPVVADLDNDGYAEVIFASWVQKESYQTGKLHILNYQGNLLREVNLPAAFGSPDWNGALAAPTLADIDGDPDLELVLTTAHSGFVAYDLPNTAEARVIWGTGRGSYLRNGVPQVTGSLHGSSISVTPKRPGPGETLSYAIELINPGEELPNVTITDTLSTEVIFQAGSLSASAGSPSENGGVITWSGAVTAGEPVTISFAVMVGAQVTEPQLITNMLLIDDGQGRILNREATAIANGWATFMPAVRH